MITYRPEYGSHARQGTGSSVEYTLSPPTHCVTHPVTDIPFAVDEPIGVASFAAALIGMFGGVTVRALCEGTVLNIAVPTPTKVKTWDGTQLSGLFQCILDAAGMNVGEAADVYFIAGPALGALTARAIGPFTFHRRAVGADGKTPVPDISLTCDSTSAAADVAGVSYNSPAKVLNYLATLPASTVSATNACFIDVKCVGDIDFTKHAFSSANSAITGNRRGRLSFRTTTAGTLFCSTPAAVQFGYGAIDWIGWKLDIKNILTWEYSAYNVKAHHTSVLSNVEMTTSDPAQIDEFPGNFGPGSKYRRGYFTPSSLPIAFQASYIHDCNTNDQF